MESFHYALQPDIKVDLGHVCMFLAFWNNQAFEKYHPRLECIEGQRVALGRCMVNPYC